jgi:hypothetical protein
MLIAVLELFLPLALDRPGIHVTMLVCLVSILLLSRTGQTSVICIISRPLTEFAWVRDHWNGGQSSSVQLAGISTNLDFSLCFRGTIHV